ncbi:hypothetical protein MchiMG62_17420 [Methanoculleus chikugoensis]|uniref:Uncharacterized protein n=1 Tax=Methanoculleus chikugoensis TaxID=118126 RepID=A0ABN5XKS4_9EURY|nr:hypothetical protein MchiMG62_17420 [Methanoculleus chikugoensis]
MGATGIPSYVETGEGASPLPVSPSPNGDIPSESVHEYSTLYEDSEFENNGEF